MQAEQKSRTEAVFRGEAFVQDVLSRLREGNLSERDVLRRDRVPMRRFDAQG